MKTLLLIAAFAGTVLAGNAALAEEFLIRGAKVYTASAQGTLENADVLVRNGKIAAVGRGLTATCCAAGVVVDARGRPLTPGLFGGLSMIGLAERVAITPIAGGHSRDKKFTIRTRWAWKLINVRDSARGKFYRTWIYCIDITTGSYPSHRAALPADCGPAPRTGRLVSAPVFSVLVDDFISPFFRVITL